MLVHAVEQQVWRFLTCSIELVSAYLQLLGIIFLFFKNMTLATSYHVFLLKVELRDAIIRDPYTVGYKP
jgi:hypothetical protein